MARSQQVAAAVALRRLGYKVRPKRRRARRALVPGSPAVGKLRPNDVIVAVDGKPVRSPRRPPAARRRTQARRATSVITVKRGGQAGDRDHPHGRRSERPEARRHRRLRRARRPTIKLPLDVKIDLGNVGGPSAGLAFALDVMEELGTDVDGGHEDRRHRRDRARRNASPPSAASSRRRSRPPVGHRRFPRAGWGQRARGAALCATGSASSL